MPGRKPSPTAAVWAACFVALLLACSGCGGGASVTGGRGNGSDAAAVSPQALRAAAHERDGDDDNDSLGMGRLDLDNDAAPTFGRPPSTAERQALVALFERYYAAAAAEDAKGVCALLYPLAVEDLLETHGHDLGLGRLRGASCEQLVGQVLMYKHHALIVKRSSLKVGIIQVRARHAMVVLGFGAAKQQVAIAHGEGRNWALTTLHEEAL